MFQLRAGAPHYNRSRCGIHEKKTRFNYAGVVAATAAKAVSCPCSLRLVVSRAGTRRTVLLKK